MTVSYEVMPATRDLAMSLVMSDVDAAEAWAAARVSPTEALEMSLDSSPEPLVFLADGRVVCVFGVGEWSVLSLYGIPWLLGSEELPQHARRFLRLTWDYMIEMRQRYRLMQNHVDARNIEAVKWLRWLDFEIDPALPFGPDQLPFHRFYWKAK